MFKNKKRIDFAQALDKAKKEAFQAGAFVLEEVEDLERRLETGGDKAVTAVKEAFNRLPPVAARRERLKFIKLVRLIAPLFIGLFIFIVVLVAVAGLSLAKVYLEAAGGKDNLEQAISLIKNGDFSGSAESAREAQKNFRNAIIKAEEINGSVLKYLPLVGTSVGESVYLLNTAEILARTVAGGSDVLGSINSLGEKGQGFSQFTFEEKGKIMAYLYQSAPELSGLAANLDLAAINLGKVRFSLLFYPLKSKINKLKNEVEQGRQILSRIIPAVKLLPGLAGYPEKKSFLFLLQNNDELRPTGGFIGNYGIIETKNGDITRFDTEDAYHLDMPVKDRINVQPPAPLKKYLIEKWYFRDSNWSPDFPSAAKTAEWFFNEETKLAGGKPVDFDGVIAITPGFITDLLAITGPIALEGREYNKDNFSKLLEYRVEKLYRDLGEREWNRKEMVGIIAAELKKKIFDLPPSRWPEILKALDNNLAEKNILLRFNDCDLQELAVSEGLAGEMKDPAGDYLMVVDANMASFKTDAAINKNLNYSLEERDGSLVASLTAHYSHKGDYDWRTTDYQTYVRVYAPAGSKILKINGLDDPVTATEKVTAGNCGLPDSERTYFGGFLQVAPGKIKSFTMEYLLPAALEQKIRQDGIYSLYWQKQPGSRVDQIETNINLPGNIAGYSPAGFSAEKISAGRVVWKSDLKTDKMFSVTLKTF